MIWAFGLAETSENRPSRQSNSSSNWNSNQIGAMPLCECQLRRLKVGARPLFRPVEMGVLHDFLQLANRPEGLAT